MSKIANIIGTRIRNYRINKNLTQEQLAELSGCHPTYIGQIERGEKNATIESVLKISTALNLTLSQLFDKIDNNRSNCNDIPNKCYEFLLSKKEEEQEQLFNILLSIDHYKSL